MHRGERRCARPPGAVIMPRGRIGGNSREPRRADSRCLVELEGNRRDLTGRDTRLPTRKSIYPPRAHSAASSERRSPANSSGPSEDGDVVAALRGLRVGAAAPAVSSQLRSHRRPQGSGYQASRSAQEIVIQHVALFASARVSHSILPGVSVPPQESGTICSTM